MQDLPDLPLSSIETYLYRIASRLSAWTKAAVAWRAGVAPPAFERICRRSLLKAFVNR